MTKLMKTLLFTTLLTNTLFSDMVFDLGAQNFYYCSTLTTDKDGTEVPQYVIASYDLDKVIVSTGLASIDGGYRPKEYQSGSFSVEIKEPKSKWTVNFNIDAKLYENGCSAQFLSDNGQSFLIYFNYQAISVAGEKKTDESFSSSYKNYTKIAGAVQMNGDNIDIDINGNKFSIKKPNFKLATVVVSISTEKRNNIEYIDKLQSLSISTSD